MQLFIIFAILIAIVGVMFAMQNTAPVVVTFALWQFQGSLALVLLLTLAAGLIIAALVSLPATLRLKWRLRRVQGQVKRLEEERQTLQAQVADLQGRIPAEAATPEETPAPARFIGLGRMMQGQAPLEDVPPAGAARGEREGL